MTPEEVQELISNQLVISIVGMIVTMIGSLVSGFFIGRFQKHRKEIEEKRKQEQKEAEERERKEKAGIAILKGMARRLIIDAYEDYILNDEHLTIDRKREITETFEAYTVFKGNGTAKEYYKALMDKPAYLVTD